MVEIIEPSYEERKMEQGLEDMVKMAEEIFEDCGVVGGMLGITMMPKDNHCPFVVHIIPSLKTITVTNPEYFDKALELGKRIEAKYPIEFQLYMHY